LKLKKAPKSVADIRTKKAQGSHMAPTSWDSYLRTMNEPRRVLTPKEAREAGKAYSGPLMDDKGKLDGSCNRTACQYPLKGEPRQWYMEDITKNHYCDQCARMFNRDDRDMRQPQRCMPVDRTHED
jgi:hypothetical protein